MVLLQQATWYNVLLLVVGGATGGGMLVLFLLKRFFFKDMDRAQVDEKRAQVKKMGAETDILIAAEAMKFVSHMKAEIERQAEFLNELQEDLNAERSRREEAERRSREIEKHLENEKAANRHMNIELEQLRVKVEQYERKNRRPT